MAERPKWFQGVVEGGRPKNVPEVSRGAVEEPNLSVVKVEKTTEDASPARVPSKRERRRSRGRESAPQKSPEEIKKERDLVNLFIHLMDNLPADFSLKVKEEFVQGAAGTVLSWSVDALHAYLSGNEIWKKPSFTKAVFGEIRERMLRGNMAPRE